MSFSGVFYDFLAKSKWLLILGFFALAGCQTVQQNSENEIEIFHTNDMHSHFAGSKNNNACIQEEGCVGGYGAIQSYVQKARKKNPDLLFLDA